MDIDNDQPPAFPALVDQEQIEAPRLPMTPVPVAVAGPVVTMRLPARSGSPMFHDLTTSMAHILGPDMRRTRVTLICDADWRYAIGQAGNGVPWYAKVPLVLEHADAIYARVPTSTGTLTIIPEFTGE
jgi:hypothetical protein